MKTKRDDSKKKQRIAYYPKRVNVGARVSSRDNVLYGYASDRSTLIRSQDTKTVKTEIAKTLYFVCELVAIAPDRVPDREVMKKYAQVIYQNFDFLHVEEIPYAFELALTGVLGMSKPNHGGFFDLAWITRTLRAYFNYRTERANVVRAIIEKEDAIRANLAARVRTDQVTRAQIVTYYRAFLESGSFTAPLETEESADAYFSVLYNFLEYAGFISISLETKKEWYTEAVAAVRPDVIRNLAAVRETETGRELTAFGARILRYKAVRRARLMAINRMFAGWKKSGVSPENVNLLLQKNYCCLDTENYTKMYQLRHA